MIKPVYFGKSNEDKRLIEFVEGLGNFSEWVREKIRKELRESGGEEGREKRRRDNVEIEKLIRRIVKEENFKIEEVQNNNETIQNEPNINIGGWTL